MEFPDQPTEGDNPAEADQRTSPRFALLLRSAKLVGPGGEYLCVVRDVSAAGVKLRLFHPLPPGEHFALESANGERFPVVLVWEQDREAGLRFVHGLDVSRFIAEESPYPKRPLRIRVDHAATVVSAGNDLPVRLLNLSRQGARIEAGPRLAVGLRLMLQSQDLPPMEATVCWRIHPAHGLVFHQALSPQDLALTALRMQSCGDAAAGEELRRPAV
jgi:hypothetical protein